MTKTTNITRVPINFNFTS